MRTFRLSAIQAILVISLCNSLMSTTSTFASEKVPEPRPITLPEAIQLGLENNPALQALAVRFERLARHEDVEGALPDPQVSYAQFIEGVQTRTGDQEFVLGVSQMFPWFGVLSLRGERAAIEAQQIHQDYNIARLDLRKAIVDQWIHLSYEKDLQDLVELDRDTLQETVDVVSFLYTNAQQGRDAWLRAQTELARVENELLGFPARIEALRAEFARLINHSGEPLEFIFAPDLEYSLHGTRDNLLNHALQSRPELEKNGLRQQQAILDRELADKQDYPEFTIGINYIGIGDSPLNPPDEGDDAWSVGIRFNVPLPNARRKAIKRIAAYQHEEAVLARNHLSNEIVRDLDQLLPQIKSITGQQEVLTTSLIPLAEEALEASRISYESGKTTFLDLLDAERTYISTRKQLVTLNRDYQLALSRLERILGHSILPIDPAEVNP